MSCDSLFAWGRGKDHRLGLGSTSERVEPTHVHALDSGSLAHVSLGNCHGAALDGDGNVWIWGGGTFGELGLGADVESAPSPRSLPAPCGQRIVHVACGFYHTACVAADGSVFTWGWGRDGQLGHSEASSTPVRLDALGGVWQARTRHRVDCKAALCLVLDWRPRETAVDGVAMRALTTRCNGHDGVVTG